MATNTTIPSRTATEIATISRQFAAQPDRSRSYWMGENGNEGIWLTGERFNAMGHRAPFLNDTDFTEAWALSLQLRDPHAI